MLVVSAKEQRSGQQASVTVQAGHGLSKPEVERLVEESVEYAREDFAARRLIEFRNKAEGDVRHAAKALAEAGDSLTAEQRSAIDRAKADLDAALTGTDSEVLAEAVGRFGEATRPLAEVLMNAVVKKALAGTAEKSLSQSSI